MRFTNTLYLRILSTWLQHANNEENLLRVINHPQCKVVVCSRMAPKQKASVVELVKVTIHILSEKGG